MHRYFEFTCDGHSLQKDFFSYFGEKSDFFTISLSKIFNKSTFFISKKKISQKHFEFVRKATISVFIPDKYFKSSGFSLTAKDLVYEDSEIVVINKPENLSTQPTHMMLEQNLFSALKAYYFDTQGPYYQYIGMLHRLDRMTSGLVLFTKKVSHNKYLSDQFLERSIEKKYIAKVTYSKFKPNQGSEVKKEGDQWEVINKLARLETTNKILKFGRSNKGQEAETHFHVLKSFEDDTLLVECQPKTGRTHQIRIHLSDNHLPILGDALYGGSDASRMHLHAQSLKFRHPKTKDFLDLGSKIPACFFEENIETSR